MAKYFFSNKAVDDLTAIWEYTYNKWSETQADNYYNLLIKACEEIASKPTLGKNYQNIAADVFGFGAGKHIIFFQKISAKEIEIVRILHEQMDLKNRIGE